MMIWDWLQWHWRAPQVLGLVLAPVVWWLWLRFRRLRKTAVIADSHLLPWMMVGEETEETSHMSGSPAMAKTTRPGRFYRALHAMLRKLVSPSLALTLAWVCAVIVLAGPYSLKNETQESEREGVDILIGMDLSRSMTAEDVSPNRFQFARYMVESLKPKLTPNDRLGLMVFAGKPHLVSPLTYDRKLFQHYLDLIEPGLLPTAGSQLKPAIRFGVSHLQQMAGQARVLVIFTNGEPVNPVEQPVPQGWASLSQSITKILLVGVGTPQRSRLPDANNNSGYFHQHGRLVLSRLETDGLKKLSRELGAEYLTADASASFLETLTNAITVAAAQRVQLDDRSVKIDHAYPFLWAMWFFFIWGLMAWPWRKRSVQRLTSWGGLLCVVLVVSGLSPTSVQADSQHTIEKQAYDAFQNRQYDESVRLYERLQTEPQKTYSGAFGAGSAAYKKGDLESAVWYFQEAILTGRTDKERAKALFNLGNTYFQAALIPHAIEAYEQALLYWPDYRKARENLALAKQQPPTVKKASNEMNGDGEGAGNRSQDQEGAFYGGQKPNPDLAGEGVAGDAPEGSQEGKEFVMPEEEDRTDFRITSSRPITQTESGAAILEQQKRAKTIEAFEHKMQRVDDHQKELLKRMFERAEGFQAVQEETHALPGVNPW